MSIIQTISTPNYHSLIKKSKPDLVQMILFRLESEKQFLPKYKQLEAEKAELLAALEIIAKQSSPTGKPEDQYHEAIKLQMSIQTAKEAIAKVKGADLSDSVRRVGQWEKSKLKPCPLCQRGDIWQEAVSRTEVVFRGEKVEDGQDVVDYLLAEVSAMLEIITKAEGKEV